MLLGVTVTGSHPRGQTNSRQNITFPQLRLWAVIIRVISPSVTTVSEHLPVKTFNYTDWVPLTTSSLYRKKCARSSHALVVTELLNTVVNETALAL